MIYLWCAITLGLELVVGLEMAWKKLRKKGR